MFDTDLNLDLSSVVVEKPKSACVPSGVYDVLVASAEIKETKQKNGKYINVMFKITEGDYKNNCVFHMFNIENLNVKAVEIGKQQLKAMLLAAGKDGGQLKNLNQLLDLELKIKTKIEVSQAYGDQLRVVDFLMKGHGLKNYAPQAPKFDNSDQIPF